MILSRTQKVFRRGIASSFPPCRFKKVVEKAEEGNHGEYSIAVKAELVELGSLLGSEPPNEVVEIGLTEDGIDESESSQWMQKTKAGRRADKVVNEAGAKGHYQKAQPRRRRISVTAKHSGYEIRIVQQATPVISIEFRRNRASPACIVPSPSLSPPAALLRESPAAHTQGDDGSGTLRPTDH